MTSWSVNSRKPVVCVRLVSISDAANWGRGMSAYCTAIAWKTDGCIARLLADAS